MANQQPATEGKAPKSNNAKQKGGRVTQRQAAAPKNPKASHRPARQPPHDPSANFRAKPSQLSQIESIRFDLRPQLRQVLPAPAKLRQPVNPADTLANQAEAGSKHAANGSQEPDASSSRKPGTTSSAEPKRAVDPAFVNAAA